VTARIVVLASGSGSTLQAILDADLPATIVAAGTDRRDCHAMARARNADVETFAVVPADFPTRTDWDRAFAERLADYQPDVVVLAGFMRILSADIVGKFRMVNTHPSLLPSFPGAHAVRDALAYGVKITGATVHWVDAGVDTGPIIAQVTVPVRPGDTEETLRARVQAAEKPLLVETVRLLCEEIAK
jgi:formyltetrahydrofolate-dependent phosphoribosylglycinamide formyltransferase